MNNVMTLWAEGFRRYYPEVGAQIQGEGSATAPPALLAGRAVLAPMSRAMTTEELAAFKEEHGFEPTMLRTSIDMVAVYVHEDCPLTGLSLEQLDALFSSTRNGGATRELVTWGDLGITDPEWSGQQVSLHGRNAASGTHDFFAQNALFGGQFKDSVVEQPDSASVVAAVAGDRFAMGYTAIGFDTEAVRTLSLAPRRGAEQIKPEPASAYTGTYPLSRFLHVYVAHAPGSRMDPLVSEFVRYIFSREGQADVVKEGFLPVSATVAARELKKLGLMPDGRLIDVSVIQKG